MFTSFRIFSSLTVFLTADLRDLRLADEGLHFHFLPQGGSAVLNQGASVSVSVQRVTLRPTDSPPRDGERQSQAHVSLIKLVFQ